MENREARHHLRIGEVAELLGVRAHVLRYWEEEFPGLRPKKTRGAHRHYSLENLALARTIKSLVVDEGYSIAGARRKLSGEEDGAPSLDDLRAARDELAALLLLLGPEAPADHDSGAVELAAHAPSSSSSRSGSRGASPTRRG